VNKKISPTMIGAFVVGAVALVVVAIIVFGSGRLFRQSREFVLYFDGSVNGLRIGAPVKFKGVEIGSVRDIRLQLDKHIEVNKIPVIIEIDLEKLTSRGATSVLAEDREAFHQAIVARGLRGQLLMESLVTGLLYIALDFLPGTPINLVQTSGREYRYPEIPTVPNTLELAQDAVTQIINKLEDIDFKGLVASLSMTVDGISRIANAPELQAALKALEKTVPKIDGALVDIRKLANTMDGSVSRLTESLEQTSAATRHALQGAEQTLKQSDAALQEAAAAMANIRAVSDQDSSTFHEIRKSLREVSEAARSVRLLANYLDRNPAALIFGRPETREEK
jgi:paraquat-inducible protein B